jgi:hypothetical protein
MGWKLIDSVGRLKHAPDSKGWQVRDSSGRGKAFLDSSMFTGTNWTDLTDAGATTLHTHAGGGGFVNPGGRLTLTSATPVLTSDVSAAGTVYYALYVHDQIPIYDGTNWTNTTFTELSNILANAATGNAGPAAGATDQNYDLFVWSNAGTMTLTRGPVWTNGTTRSAGTALVRQNGIWLNNAAITNGPGASRGTYVGTIRTITATATVSWELGGTGAGGDPGFLYVWNCYNRISVAFTVLENTNSWTYTTAAYRSLNNSTSNRVSYVAGLSEDWVRMSIGVLINTGSGQNAVVAIGVDSTTAQTGVALINSQNLGALVQIGEYSGIPGLGLHFLQGIEYGTAVGGTFYGDNGATNFNSGLNFLGRF